MTGPTAPGSDGLAAMRLVRRAPLDAPSNGTVSAMVDELAPALPPWFAIMVVRTLSNPAATPDTLLILADALREAAAAASADGALLMARQLRNLADLPAALAQRRPHRTPGAARKET